MYLYDSQKTFLVTQIFTFFTDKRKPYDNNTHRYRFPLFHLLMIRRFYHVHVYMKVNYPYNIISNRQRGDMCLLHTHTLVHTHFKHILWVCTHAIDNAHFPFTKLHDYVLHFTIILFSFTVLYFTLHKIMTF